jgi:hypothetical protein
MRSSLSALVLALILSACGEGGEDITGPTTGDLTITTATTGETTATGYLVSVDGGTAEAIGLNGTLTKSDLSSGTHSVVLSGLPEGCTLEGGASRSADIATGETATVSYAITCAAPVGAIRIATTTTGPTPASLEVLLDGTSRGAVTPSAALTLENITTGTHSVALSAIPANCQVQGENPRSAVVTPGQTAEVAFSLTCTEPPAQSGTMVVTATTSGPQQDPDGYLFAVDGGAPQAIGVSGSISLANVAAGSHTVLLSGLAANCTTSSSNPQTITVTAGASTTASFAVQCTAAAPTTGSIRLTTATTGENPDADGYAYAIDAGAEQPIGANATVTLQNQPAGSHSVRLAGIAGNCTVSGENPRSITVTAGVQTDVAFTVTCSAAGTTTGSIRLTAVTTGSNPDADGYTYSLDGGAEQPIGANTAVTLENQTAGSHSIRLAGIATNCTLAEENPRTFNVTAGAQSDVTFTVTCAAPGGLRWTPMESGTDNNLAEVWGSSASDVYALENWQENGYMAAIRHYDGTAWTRQATFDELQLVSIWGTSPNDIFAVGGRVIMHFDGVRWALMHEQPESGLELRRVWGLSGSNVFVVGGAYDAGWMPRALKYDGTSWTEFSLPSHQAALNDVFGSSAQDVYAVGEAVERSNDWPPEGVIYHYDGTAWTLLESAPPNTGLMGVWTASATQVFAVGMKYVSAARGPDSFIWRYDGAGWTEMATPNVGQLEDVWGSSATDVYAVGPRGIIHYDGTSWTVVQESAQPLRGLWAASPDNLFAVGAGGTILHGIR